MQTLAHLLTRRLTPIAVCVLCLAATIAAEPPQPLTPIDVKVRDYEQRMNTQPGPTAPNGPVRAGSSEPVNASSKPVVDAPNLDDVIWLNVPDPSNAAAVFDQRQANTRHSDTVKREYQRIYDDAKAYVREIERPAQYRLTLHEALQRAIASNFLIRIDSFAPAISTAQAVQAESVFDTAFFAQVNRNNTDRPAINQLSATKTDTTTVNGGIRQLLASGAQVSFAQTMVRVDNPGFQFQTVNPIWQQAFVAELRQPVLRNFGMDFNRAQINIRKTERKINEQAFRARVIEVLNNTERAYWDLARARREVTIGAELLAQAQLTLRQVEARREFDSYLTLVSASRATVSNRQFIYIQLKNTVRNAEDLLQNLMNDKELAMAKDLELIPIDIPTTVELVRDRVEEVATALRSRPEIIQARHGVDVARLQLGIAKNQALPQLDVVYRMTLNGLGNNSDNAFDQMTSGNFTDQYVGIEFAWNFAERGERAGIRVAALTQSRAVTTYKKAIDDVIIDCRVALRNLNTSYEQLSPSSDAVVSGIDRLRALQERQERKSPAELDAVFNAQVSLAEGRRALLAAVIAYNQGIVDVERAKGTLLEYDNVVIANEP